MIAKTSGPSPPMYRACERLYSGRELDSSVMGWSAAATKSTRERFSQIFVENFQFSNKECASISQNFVENGSFSNKEFHQKWLNFKGGVRDAVSCRVGRSPIRFFDLILNNALALRASHNTSIPESVIEHLLKHSRHEAR